MADLDLDAIEARAYAATPGPWEATDYRIVETAEPVLGDEGCADVCEVMHYGNGCGGRHNPSTARFIAAARTDVPALVAEVRRLRARVADLTAGILHDLPVGFTEIRGPSECFRAEGRSIVFTAPDKP